jgi:hypothetical protein
VHPFPITSCAATICCPGLTDDTETRSRIGDEKGARPMDGFDSYFDLGPYRRRVTTSAPEAQRWFDRGLNWLFGFNHGEAIKCFQ